MAFLYRRSSGSQVSGTNPATQLGLFRLEIFQYPGWGWTTAQTAYLKPSLHQWLISPGGLPGLRLKVQLDRSYLGLRAQTAQTAHGKQDVVTCATAEVIAQTAQRDTLGLIWQLTETLLCLESGANLMRWSVAGYAPPRELHSESPSRRTTWEFVQIVNGHKPNICCPYYKTETQVFFCAY